MTVYYLSCPHKSGYGGMKGIRLEIYVGLCFGSLNASNVTPMLPQRRPGDLG